MIKKYLSVGEIAKEVGVATHTIRFWTETFTKSVSFVVGKGGRKYYHNSAIPVFKAINALIHEKGYKIKYIISEDILNKYLTNSLNTDPKKEAVEECSVLAKKALKTVSYIKANLEKVG